MAVSREQQATLLKACAGAAVYATDSTRPVGAITQAWESARERAGLKLRIHDLRHLAASRTLDSGVAPPKVAKALGWAPSTMAHMAARTSATLP